MMHVFQSDNFAHKHWPMTADGVQASK